MTTNKQSGGRARWRQAFFWVGTIVVVLWALEILDWALLSGRLDHYGIVPRTVDGLWGIPASPLLHGGFEHLIANTAPLMVLGLLLVLRGRGEFLGATALIVLLGGLGVWLTGADNSVHIGASGVVFGYFGYLVLAGVLERRLVSLFTSALVGFLYGGMLWGVMPTDPRVSWQAHLFGFLAGLVAAWWIVPRGKRSQPEDTDEAADGV